MKLKRPFEKIVGVVTALAFVMILSQTTGDSMAYFTTYATAEGGHTVTYQLPKTEINETVDGWVKSVVIRNTGMVPCFVRVKAFAAESLTYSSESGKWTQGSDDYWYYSEVVPAGGSTDTLVITINHTAGQNLKYDIDVIVVQESVPVSYTSDGAAFGDWNARREAAQ